MLITSILVPTDFSEDSYYALNHAIEIAQRRQCPLTILHVNHDESMLHHYLSEREYEKLKLEALADARIELEKLVERFPGLKKISYSYHIRRGIPYVEILDELENNPVDLVVIGSHGRSNLALKYYYGTTVEKIVRRAKTSILVTRTPEKKK
jgi:universal stress protein A